MKIHSLLLAIVAISIIAIGCDDPKTDTADSPTTPATADPHAGHDHGAADHTAPHGGHLIELGHNHEYHAELLDDHKTETITVYIMDGDMKPLAIKQSSVSLIMTVGDDTQTFELAGGEADASSEFSSNDEKMMGMIDSEGVTGKLRVTIDGKPFSGAFEHLDHSHAGHSHD